MAGSKTLVDVINETYLTAAVLPSYGVNTNYIMGVATASPHVNNTMTSQSPVYTSPAIRLGHAITIGVLLGSLIIITLLGNGLVITAVASFRRLRSVTNYFVVSLAVADITVATLVMPYALLYEIFAEWRFGWVFCYFWISCDVMCCTASILHLCVIALDRYLAITQPFSYHQKMSKRRALLMIAIVWVCSGAISFLPIYLGWFADSSKMEDLYVDSPMCGLYVNKIYAVISSGTSFYAPLLVMIFAYCKIFRIARKQAKEIQRLENSITPDSLFMNNGSSRGDVRKRSKRVQRDTKAIKTLGTLVGLFCISWLPFFLMYVIVPFCESCVVPPILASAITWLGYTNSCINPCVYAFLNRDFRIAFKRILSCGGKCGFGPSRNHFSRTNSRYRSEYCDEHPGSACHCEMTFAARRHSSSSSGGRTPSLGSHERFKIEMSKTRTNGYSKSRSHDKRHVTEQESPLTEALEFKGQDRCT